MAKNRSEHSRYPSKYAPKGWVTPAQYIIELICEKKALSDGRALSVKFWDNPEWAKFFTAQLRMCHSLIKKYSDKAIIRALQDNRTKNTYSLRAPWLLPIIEEHHKIILSEDKRLMNAKPTEAMVGAGQNTSIRVAPTRKNTLSKLRDLDGEKES